MKSGKRSAFLCAIAILTGANQSQATETTTYSYDTLGRLVQSNVSGGPASGVQTATSYDPAGNRTNQTTVGVQPPSTGTCTFAAGDVEGTDEFTLYPYIALTGSCSGPVTVAASVEYVSGQGNYEVYPGYAGMTFQPGDPTNATRFIRILAYYGSVPPENPLILRVNWTITSGSGTVTDGSGAVTIISSI